VNVDGVVSNKVGISAWVDVFEPVLCAARKIKKGEILSRKDIYKVRKNTSYLSTEVITNSSKALGFMAKHSLQPDRPLERWMLERAPVLEKGDIVTILAESHDLTVTVPGKVLENGYLGELVMVQNTMSKKEIYARVLNTTTVKVLF
jgi:flagellar basal body P-ring formation protein FlgA